MIWRWRRAQPEPTFLFIFGINNSGTTVTSQYLAQQTDGYLPPFGNFEGQFVPSVKEIFRTRPWQEDKQIDWPFVREEWTRLAVEDGRDIFVEASPPHIIRVDEVLAAFKGSCRAIFLVSDPYMQIASCLKNYGPKPMTDEAIETFCDRWITKARWQATNRASHPEIPFITYEAFCADPTVLNRAFDIPVRPREAIAGKVSGAKHGREPVRDIRDMSLQTIAFLQPAEVLRITECLSGVSELVTGFGYDLLDEAGFTSRLSNAPEQAAAGQAIRKAWKGRK